MKYFLLLIFCFTCFTASAQWWRIGPLKKKRPEPITSFKPAPLNTHGFLIFAPVKAKPLRPFTIESYYSLYRAESNFMKNAKHNMRFRQYEQASYDFSELAKVYAKQSRFSEAKWYLLQSNQLARRQNDYWHVYYNLLKLAEVKVSMGDMALAKQDLTEALDMASARGWDAEITEVKKRLQNIPHFSKTLPANSGIKYAEVAADDSKSK